MSQLQSMLVPLDTLAGWPPANDPSVLQVVGLLIGFPALVFAIIYAIAKIGTVAQAGRGGPAEVTQPVWVGGRQASGEWEADGTTSAATSTGRAEVTVGSSTGSSSVGSSTGSSTAGSSTGSSSVGSSTVSSSDTFDEPQTGSGGAGARW